MKRRIILLLIPLTFLLSAVLAGCVSYSGGSGLTLAANEDEDGDGLTNGEEEDLGTDPYIRDIFIEIDYMVPATTKNGMTLTKKALQLVETAFAARDIRIHFDAGDYFPEDTDSAVPIDYDRGGGNEVSYVAYISTTGIDCDDAELSTGNTCTDDFTTIQDIKADNFDNSRRDYYHYMILGDFGYGDAVFGVAEQPGNDFAVAFGDLLEATDVTTPQINNTMAAAIMHGLGHNMGLSHGGSSEDAELNNKPNYESTMNYVYITNGLNKTGTGEQWKQFSYEGGHGCAAPASGSYLSYDPTVEDIQLDFSEGLNLSINEREVQEIDGYSAETTIPVDFDCDGNPIETNAREQDLTFDEDDEGNSDPELDELHDHDDWSALIFDFTTTGNGQSEKSGAGSAAVVQCYFPASK